MSYNNASATVQKHTLPKIPYQIKVIKGFTTEGGFQFDKVNVAFETFGRLNRQKNNAILVFHAFSGSSHVTRNNFSEKFPGWWEGLVGPGKTIDTNQYFVICANVLGGCYGTTGPSSINPLTGKPYNLDFPVINIRDMVRLQKRLLDSLGIRNLYAVIGGSMGGMLAQEWAITFPNTLKKAVIIAAPPKQSPIQVAFNHIAIQAILNDPNWVNGNYTGKYIPQKGLALARMMGIITYKSKTLFEKRFEKEGKRLFHSIHDKFDVENYLLYQGEKFVSRFDANTYIYLSKAMNLHDISLAYGSMDAALSRIKCNTLWVGIDSDILYPPREIKETVYKLQGLGSTAFYKEIQSIHGHDAFLIEYDQLSSLVGDFLINNNIDKGEDKNE